MSINVILVHNNQLMIDGLSSLIKQDLNINIKGIAHDDKELIILSKLGCDYIVITDYNTLGLNGIDIIKTIKNNKPNVRFICISVNNDIRHIRTLLDSGYSGILTKNCSFEELKLAIRKAFSNDIYINHDMVSSVLSDYQLIKHNPSIEIISVLTPKEREITRLFAEGYSRNEIADHLNISIKTVATHRDSIMKKLHIKGIAELTKFALREGICSIDK